AITAVLQATFKDQTYYGLPLENFDEAVAWIHRSDQSVSQTAPGRILVYSHTAYFYLWPAETVKPNPNEHNLWIRSRNGALSGFINVPTYYTIVPKGSPVEFIILSLGKAFNPVSRHNTEISPLCTSNN